MITRLTPQDASFFRMESSSNPVHIGSLFILDNSTDSSSNGNGPALDYESLVDLVESRLSLVPRYRRKVREIPLSLGRPVWVEDSRFDITYHVRRSALPAPGSAEQLHELVARLTSRPLDASRPLWEMYLIEGLSEGRCALFTRTHSALVDGETALDIGHVVLDGCDSPRSVANDSWHPQQEPSDADLLLGVLSDLAGRPGAAFEVLREARHNAAGLVGAAERTLDTVVTAVRSTVGGAPYSPLNKPTSRQRRFAVASTSLDDCRAVHRHTGCSINDVILAVVTGALREWLMSRDAGLVESTILRAVVPMSVYAGDDTDGRTVPNEVTPFLISLPVGEPNPVMRLSHISHAMEEQSRHRRAVRARTLVHLTGFAPASLHAASVRAASTFADRTFNLVITNAPGPQTPMYIGGARMLEMYPVSPLLRNQASSIGITSYDGRVYYGLNADREAMADIAVLAALIPESMEEILGACL
ncbi:WS/DGAT/MGAT family O-acyltransferase [Nocardia paucivorans]|uniref:WS/DGAT/MGAT family O-acyltransferase n=1 Tax=Nocardia paucivorans TaxID=114259 RepID=UPI0002EE3270|nr:wax ester/triacylglycerol synthase family O-acyltransferase [Nocardia paucivorans]